jgi:hypothetical protein
LIGIEVSAPALLAPVLGPNLDHRTASSINGKGIRHGGPYEAKNWWKKRLTLIAEIEHLLPDFARSCRENLDVVIIHQDSFAADYQDEEYTLFGKAIKYSCRESYKEKGARLARLPLPAEAGSPRRELIYGLGTARISHGGSNIPLQIWRRYTVWFFASPPADPLCAVSALANTWAKPVDLDELPARLRKMTDDELAVREDSVHRDFNRIRRQLQPSGAHHTFWLRGINIPTLLALASTPHRANRLLQEKLDFPIQGSALSRSELSQAGLEIRRNTNQ